MANKIKKMNFIITYNCDTMGIKQSIAQIIARTPEEAIDKFKENFKMNIEVVSVVSSEVAYDWQSAVEDMGTKENEEPFDLKKWSNEVADRIFKNARRFDDIVDLDKFNQKQGGTSRNERWHQSHQSGIEKTANY